MNEAAADWTETVRKLFAQLTREATDFLPQLAAGIALLLLGWVVARLARALVIRLLGGMDGLVRRIASDRVADQVRIRQTSALLLGNLLFWVIVLVFLTAAARQLGLSSFSQWLDNLINYLPTLVSGVLIILVGHYLSLLARDTVHTAATTAGIEQSLILGRLARAAVLVTALVIGADQLGVNVTLLVVLTAVILGALLGGGALAFSLGARQMVSNLLAAQQLRQHYRIGDQIRIGEHQGSILEITARAVVLETDEGRVQLPASCFDQQPCVTLSRDAVDL
jgi:small-conductance mechanosensitive channel